MKHLELFRQGFDSTLAEKVKTENYPYVGYDAVSGLMAYTEILKPVTGPADNEIWYTSKDGNVVTPNKTDVFGANIVSNTYENGKGVITFDGEVTSIGEKAFYKCSGLTSVTIGNSVTSIGGSAFERCPFLTSVTIGNSVASIGNLAFYKCSGLTSVTLHSNSIVGKTYSYSTAIRNIFGSQVKEYIIGNSVTSIGNYAFYKCSSLTSITIPDSVTSIGHNAFADCSSLTSVTIPNSVTSIGHDAFYYCSGLTSITISNGVTSIGDSAFSYCPSLTSVTIPNSVTSIGKMAFSCSYDLTSIIYEGTQAQWNTITKGNDWNNSTSATYVQCTDGQVTL